MRWVVSLSWDYRLNGRTKECKRPDRIKSRLAPGTETSHAVRWLPCFTGGGQADIFHCQRGPFYHHPQMARSYLRFISFLKLKAASIFIARAKSIKIWIAALIRDEEDRRGLT